MSAVKKDPSFIWRIATLTGITGSFTTFACLGLRHLSKKIREKEERQTKRRILYPRWGVRPDGRLLVGKIASAVIYLEQVKEFRSQYLETFEIFAPFENLYAKVAHMK